MNEKLKLLQQQVPEDVRDTRILPLDRWQPPLSGDIDIRILADGTWLHEGTPIRRAALVRLFASILRREADGEYYLVTPVEKWRIQVELHPLVVEDIDGVAEDGEAGLLAICNTGRQVLIGPEHGLVLEPAANGAAVVTLEHGLTALFSRKAWLRLVEQGDCVDGSVVIRSAGSVFSLGEAEH